MSSYSSSRSAMHRARQADTKASTPQEVTRHLAWTRREFLRNAAGIALGSSLLPSSLLARTGIPSSKRKVVVITFGGGARDQETFAPDRKSTRLNSSHGYISYAVFCLKKKKKQTPRVNHRLLHGTVAL